MIVLALGLAVYNFGYWAVVAVFVLYSDTVLQVSPIGYGAYFAVLAAGGVLSGWFGTGIGALVGGWVAGGYGLSAPMIVAMIVQLAAAITVWIFRR